MNMKKLAIATITALSLLSALAQGQDTDKEIAAGVARAQTLNQEMSGLADKLSKALVSHGFTNVAALDFTDIQGQPTELGRFLSEQLTVEMVLTGGVSMLDRANKIKILEDHKLTEEGLVNPTNAVAFGNFAAVNVILIGNVTALDDEIVLMVKAISTESSKIVTAGRITFPKTSEIQQLLNRGISSNGNASPATPSAAGSGTSYRDAIAIATKDIGSLRAVLKSVLPLKLDRGRMGIRCSFDFISLEKRREIVVAFNAIDPGSHILTMRDYDSGGYNINTMGNGLRSTLVDENGDLWHALNSDVVGMNIVGVGFQDPPGWSASRGAYSPTEIVTVLQRQDNANSNTDTRQYAGQNVGSYQFVFGSMTPISPGQSVTVTVNFIRDENQTTSGAPPKVFQIASEIVVGVAAADGKKTYSLHNLTFDRVSLPAGSR